MELIVSNLKVHACSSPQCIQDSSMYFSNSSIFLWDIYKLVQGEFIARGQCRCGHGQQSREGIDMLCKDMTNSELPSIYIPLSFQIEKRNKASSSWPQSQLALGQHYFHSVNDPFRVCNFLFWSNFPQYNSCRPFFDFLNVLKSCYLVLLSKRKMQKQKKSHWWEKHFA